MTLTPELVLQAYRNGLFPMADGREAEDIFWVEPKFRGVIPLDDFRLSRSLIKRLRKTDYSVTLNRAFLDVIDGCADRAETWINPSIRAVFAALHDEGKAHSLEVWSADQRLIGGVYGLAIGGAFFGESMFSRQRDASKIALAWLTTHLLDCGFALFDTQFITDHLASLGAIEIPRSDYLLHLSDALELSADILSAPLPANGQDVVQRRTQTS